MLRKGCLTLCKPTPDLLSIVVMVMYSSSQVVLTADDLHFVCGVLINDELFGRRRSKVVLLRRHELRPWSARRISVLPGLRFGLSAKLPQIDKRSEML